MSTINGRLEVTPGKHKIDWDLPEAILDYVVENFEKYIKDKAIKKPILHIKLIPSNIGGFLKMGAKKD